MHKHSTYAAGAKSTREGRGEVRLRVGDWGCNRSKKVKSEQESSHVRVRVRAFSTVRVG